MVKVSHLFLIFFFLNCTFAVFADDDPGDPFPIKGDGGGPTTSKTPNRFRIYYYIEGNELIIDSTVETIGSITLVDVETNAVVFTTPNVLFNPEYRIDISDFSGSYILSIKTPNQSYDSLIIL